MRRVAVAILAALASLAWCGLAHADPAPVVVDEAPAYTLEVDSDVDAISFDAVAAQLAGDLRSPIERPGRVPAHVVLRVHYRSAAHELSVRADHGEGRILERTVKAEGDDAAVVREASLLVGNLARDEAREILDALALRPSRRPPVAAPPPQPPAAPREVVAPEPDYGATFALVYPVATNFGHPNVTSHVDSSIVLGRVGQVDGLQVSGIATYAGRGVRGVQLASAASVIDGDLHGVQGGGVSVVHGASEGVQVALAANVRTEDASGVQLGGGFQIASKKMTGAQVGGIANLSHAIEGVQMSAVNIATEVTGVQLGIVNIGRHVKGVQFGLVNVAEDVDGQAFGLVSISRHSIHPIIWGSNLAYTNAGLKFTGKYFYTLATLVFGSHETGFGNLGFNGGVGRHIPMTPISPKLDAEPEVVATFIDVSKENKSHNLWLSYRLNVGYTLAEHLRVFVGASARFSISVVEGSSVVRPEVVGGVQF